MPAIPVPRVHLKGEGNLLDATPAARHFALGGVQQGVYLDGKFGGLAFAGNRAQRLNDLLTGPVANFTVAFWCYTGRQNRLVRVECRNPDDHDLRFSIEAGRRIEGWVRSGGASYVTTPPLTESNSLHHCALVVDTENARLYLDGYQQHYAPLFDDGRVFLEGDEWVVNASVFLDTQCDDFAVFDTPLPAETVRLIAESGLDLAALYT